MFGAPYLLMHHLLPNMVQRDVGLGAHGWVFVVHGMALAPENQLLSLMGDYFELVVSPIHKNGGDVLKFMGDGILAIFDANGEAAEASRAAVVIRELQ